MSTNNDLPSWGEFVGNDKPRPRHSGDPTRITGGPEPTRRDFAFIVLLVITGLALAYGLANVLGVMSGFTVN